MQRTFCDICDAAMDPQPNKMIVRMETTRGYRAIITVSARGSPDFLIPVGLGPHLDVCGGCLRKAIELHDQGGAAP